MQVTGLAAGNNRGFVLLLMLVFIQIAALFITREISAIVYLKKSELHHEMFARQGYEMTKLMRQVDSYQRPVCMVKNISHSAIANKGLQWWRQHGCMIKYREDSYFFVREYLGVDKCTGIRNKQNHIVESEYYRNTLLHEFAVTNSESQLLQDTIVVPGKAEASCAGKLRIISPGMKMQRQL